jgi:hypothetical protein
MNCKAMVEAMAAKKYWSSPNGKTPAATRLASGSRIGITPMAVTTEAVARFACWRSSGSRNTKSRAARDESTRKSSARARK